MTIGKSVAPLDEVSKLHASAGGRPYALYDRELTFPPRPVQFV
jgi:hypothetical protein